MAWYTYANRAAFDPNTRDIAPPGSAGQVFAVSDNTFSAPVATYDLTGIPIELVAGEHGFLPTFQVEDHVELKWVSGEYVFHLNTTTPLFGPQGDPGTDGADGSNVIPTADAVAAEVGTEGAPARSVLEDLFRKKHNTVADVTEYGARADGSDASAADNSAAFVQALAVLDAAGGGELFIPNTGGKYVVGAVDLPSNISIRSNGARIMSAGNNVFRLMSGARQGYGAVTNVTISGLIFEGDFATGRTAAVTAHHAQGLTIEDCIFTQVVKGNHAIDLCGCKDVLISRCVFQGTNPATTGAEYKEAIQLDSSYLAGMGGVDDPAGFDGLPCENVTVDGCTFEPITVGGITYKAPPPFGNHVGMTLLSKNIKFTNNTVKHVFPQTTQINGAAWLKFFGIQGLLVAGNTFISDGQESHVVRVNAVSTGVAPGSYANPTPSYGAAITQEPTRDITVRGNRFQGFNAVANRSTVSVLGLASAPARNVLVDGNTFIDCIQLTGTSAQGADLIDLNIVSGAVIVGNNAHNVRRLALIRGGSEDVTVAANNVYNARYIPVNVELSSFVKIVDNAFTKYGGGVALGGCTNPVVRGNTFRDNTNADKPSWMVSVIRCVGGTSRGVITNNTILGTAPTHTTGIEWGESSLASTKGIIKDNHIVGFATPVAVLGSSTATVAGNEV